MGEWTIQIFMNNLRTLLKCGISECKTVNFVSGDVNCDSQSPRIQSYPNQRITVRLCHKLE